MKEHSGTRLRRLLDARQIDYSDFAKSVKVSPQVLNNWFSRGLSKSGVFAAAKALKVAPEYLVSGESESNVRELPENYHVVRVPVLTWVQAGPFVESYVSVEPIEYIALPLKNTRRAYCLIVEGDSMVGPPGSDSYPPGSYIVLNPDLEPQNGSRVVAKKKGTDEATFKVFRREGSELWLRPLNPQYQAIPMTSDYVIIGVVIGTWIPQKNGDTAKDSKVLNSHLIIVIK